MLRTIVVAAIVVTSAAAVDGQTVTYTLSVVPPSPSLLDTFTLDVLVTVPPEDDWTAGGVEALALLGTSWHYTVNDPNVGPAITAPGGTDPERFGTFVNNPRSQTASGRFTAPAAISGSYSPASPTPVIEPTEFDVTWLESPPVSTSLDTNAAVLRLTLNTRGTVCEGQLLDFTHDPGDLQVFTVEIATTTLLHPEPVVMELSAWGCPEPATVMLLLLGAVGLRRHPRRGLGADGSSGGRVGTNRCNL